MKTISKFLSFIFISIFVISCSLNEEITFHANGKIEYNYSIDGSSFMKMMPDSSSQKQQVRDSVISLANFLEEKKDSISMLPADQQAKLMSLKPLKLRLYQNDIKKDFLIQIMGNFNSSNELNTALEVFNQMMNAPKSNSKEKADFIANTHYEWNGKILKKTSTASETMKTDSTSKNALTMFSGGKYKVKYTFPKRVKKVDNSKALLSQDGKSVTLEYDASEYLISPEKTDLIVELE